MLVEGKTTVGHLGKLVWDSFWEAADGKPRKTSPAAGGKPAKTSRRASGRKPKTPKGRKASPKPTRRGRQAKVVIQPTGPAEERYVKHGRKWLRMIDKISGRDHRLLHAARAAYTQGSDADRHRVRVEFYAARGLEADRWLDFLDRDLALFAALPDPERAAGLREFAAASVQFANEAI